MLHRTMMPRDENRTRYDRPRPSMASRVSCGPHWRGSFSPMSDWRSAIGSEFEFWNVAQATVGVREGQSGCRRTTTRGRTGKVALALVEADEAAKEVGDAGREGRHDAEADRDDVELGELVGREREGDLVEQEARREDRRVDCGVDEDVSRCTCVCEEGRAHSC